MPSQRRNHILYTLLGTAWVGVVALGFTRLQVYESTSGVPAHPCARWPGDTHVLRAARLPTLVLFVHPHCPCSRATIGELAKLMTDCQGRLSATVLVLRPDGMPERWEQTDLWQSAAAIPGVLVLADSGGAESRRFGAATSGQALLYSAGGEIVFAGGITESRGHAGDNKGRSTVVSLVLKNQSSSQPVQTAVYGCPLCDDTPMHQGTGEQACRTK